MIRSNTKKFTSFPKIAIQIPKCQQYNQQKIKYSKYFQNFQDRINVIYEKENYRMHLQEKASLKVYQKLLKQKQQIKQQIETQKHIKNDRNKTLANQILKLQYLSQQYQQLRQKYDKSTLQHRKTIQTKKRVSLQIQNKIKQTWINKNSLQFNSGINFNNSSHTQSISVCNIRKSQISETNSIAYNNIKINRISTDNHNVKQNKTQIQSDNRSFKQNIFKQKTSFIRLPSIYQYLKLNKKPSDDKVQEKLNKKKQDAFKYTIWKQRQNISVMRLFLSYLRRNFIDVRQKVQQGLLIVQDFKKIDVGNLLLVLQQDIIQKDFLVNKMNQTLKLNLLNNKKSQINDHKNEIQF